MSEISQDVKTDRVPASVKRSAYDLVREKFSAAQTPTSAMIEIADRCNEVCVHCYQVQGQKGEMTTEQLKKVLDDLAEMNVLFLTISGGEATLRKDFMEIMEYAYKKRFVVSLFTNGINVDRKLAERLKGVAVQQVEISLYSHRAEVHDWVTKVPGSWEKTVAAVKHLVDLKVNTVVKTPIMSVNADEYDAFIDFVQTLGAEYSVSPNDLYPREGGDRSPQALNLRGDQLVKIKSDPAVLGGWKPGPDGNPLTKSVCGACAGGVHIEADGQLRPCTQLDIDCGSAVEEGVKEAWENNANRSVIRSLKWGNLHGCRDCDLRPYCHRCYSKAKVHNGDAMGPYLAACEGAKSHYVLAHGTAPIINPSPSELQRDGEVGPFKRVGEHHFDPVEDLLTDNDREFAEANPWVHGQANQAPQAAIPGELVQIRRPGKASKSEQVPR